MEMIRKQITLKSQLVTMDNYTLIMRVKYLVCEIIENINIETIL